MILFWWLYRHVAVFKVLKPNARTLHELYFGRGPTKIWFVFSLKIMLIYCFDCLFKRKKITEYKYSLYWWNDVLVLCIVPVFDHTNVNECFMWYFVGSNLRLDSMSQILTHCNVRSGSRLMVVESCNGLLLGAILERMAGIWKC